MKAQQVIQQLQAVLPEVTDLFTVNISITSLTYSGGTVTAVTATAHGRTTGDKVNIVGATNPIAIASLTRSGTVGTAVTASDHDLTLSDSDIRRGDKMVDLSGASEIEFNGSFLLLSVRNRREFTFQMVDSGPTTATGSPTLDNGSQLPGFNGRQTITVSDATTFTYPVSQVLAATAGGTPVVKTEARISGAADIDRANAAYSKQGIDELWAFVVLGDVIASKNRDVGSDLTDTAGRNSAWRQRLAQPVTVYAFIPTTSDLSGRTARDQAEDISVPLFKSLLGVKFPTGYTADEYVLTFVNHGTTDYNTAYYVHEYNFELAADIVFEDTVGYDFDTAFREIDLSITTDQGTGIEPATASINLDPSEILPSNLPNLIQWNRFNTGITVTGSGVSQWADQSGNGNHFKQSIDANRPLKLSTGAILSDGISQSLKTDTYPLDQPLTIYLLGNQKTFTATDYLMDGYIINTASLRQFSTSPILRVFAGADSPNNSDLGIDAYGVITIVLDGANGLFRIDKNTPITGNFGNASPNGFTIGANGNNAAWSNLEYREFCVFTEVHDNEKQDFMIDYLSGVG